MADTANKDKGLGHLIGPTDPGVDNQAREKLIVARVGMLLRQPFFGNLATRLKLVNADEWLPTAATDGRHFYYNSRFVMMLSSKELEFLFGHEVLHVAYDHMDRRGSRNGQLHNIACDYCVNGDLVTHKVGELIKSVPVLYDKKYDGWSSEEVYDDLLKDTKFVSMQDIIDALGDKVLDEHLDGGQGEGEGDEGEDGNGGKGRIKLTEEEKQQIRDEFREAMISAAQQSGAGNIPGRLRRMLKDITEPQMDWRELLRMKLQSIFKSDFSWARTSRKSWHLDAIMPGMTPGEEVDVVVAIDTSGSMTEKMVRDFLGEVQGIMNQFDGYRIHLMTFDTEVYNPQMFTSENLEHITDYEVNGGGGTMFECVFEYLKDSAIEPERLVVLTDGYPCGTWGDENYCDTLFIVHGNESIVAPFGQTAYYKG